MKKVELIFQTLEIVSEKASGFRFAEDKPLTPNLLSFTPSKEIIKIGSDVPKPSQMRPQYVTAYRKERGYVKPFIKLFQSRLSIPLQPHPY